MTWIPQLSKGRFYLSLGSAKTLKHGSGPTCSHTRHYTYLWSLLWAVLKNSVQDLHVVGISCIRKLIENHKLNCRAQVIPVCIQQLSAREEQRYQSQDFISALFWFFSEVFNTKSEDGGAAPTFSNNKRLLTDFQTNEMHLNVTQNTPQPHLLFKNTL